MQSGWQRSLLNLTQQTGSRELERVVEEYRSWPDYINSEFGGEKDPKRRALLIAVAALDGSPAHTIVAARRDFLTALGYQTTPILVLGEPNLEGQLQQIRAHLLEGNVSINSAFPGMDQAILRHFWANYQELHDYLLEWLLRLAVLPGVDDDSRARLSRLIFLITRTNRDFGIVDKMNRLARYPEQRRMIETILEFASVDEDTGQAARELLLRWAKGKSSPNQLAVAKVCRSAFAIAFPQLVATRLRWLLISEDPSVRQEAYKTLRWLAVHSDEAHSPFAVVIDWMQKDESATALAGKRGFAALMIPEGDAAFLRSFLGEGVWRGERMERLSRGWSLLLADSGARAEVADLVHQWAVAGAKGVLPASAVVTYLAEMISPAARSDFSLLQVLLDPVAADMNEGALAIFRAIRDRVLRFTYDSRSADWESGSAERETSAPLVILPEPSGPTVPLS